MRFFKLDPRDSDAFVNMTSSKLGELAHSLVKNSKIYVREPVQLTSSNVPILLCMFILLTE